jgi:hypothetical protein
MVLAVRSTSDAGWDDAAAEFETRFAQSQAVRSVRTRNLITA